jgi:hypothetical protein
MEQNKFFIWTSRITSILFLLLLVISIGLAIYVMQESRKWGARNSVEIVGEVAEDDVAEDLRLGSIINVCGKDVQYVMLSSSSSTKGLSSGGYGSRIRNIVFFVGSEMDSHWLFDTNKHLINSTSQLKTSGDSCKEKETASIYYEVVKDDTNNDGSLNEEDHVTLFITAPDGRNPIELESEITSVIDYSVDADGQLLTVLMQKGTSILMKKYSLEDGQLASEREVSRIGKKL